jgi:hypothetical protein
MTPLPQWLGNLLSSFLSSFRYAGPRLHQGNEATTFKDDVEPLVASASNDQDDSQRLQPASSASWGLQFVGDEM